MSSHQPNFPYHSMYIYNTFVMQQHNCGSDCGCISVNCKQHWQWKNGSPPLANTGDYRGVDYQLYYWNAYRGKVANATATKQESFLASYDQIIKWARSLDGTTIFCNWDSKVVADVYDHVKAVYAGQTMPATKTLYFLVPDLFIILDREQVWPKWRNEMGGKLRYSINKLTGADYVAILNHVRTKIQSAITSNQAFSLDSSKPVTVQSVDQLRLLTPLQLNLPTKTGHTLGKVIDNIIRNKFQISMNQTTL